MGATVTIQELNNGSVGNPVYTDITSTVFQTRDNISDPNYDYPIPIPDSGYHYSYWKAFCLNFTGDFTKISNIRFYCQNDSLGAWTLGTGGEVVVAVKDSAPHGIPNSSYQPASGTEGTTGDEITAAHPHYSNVTNISNFHSVDTALVIDNNSYDSPGRSYHAVFQVKVASDATQGVMPNISFVFVWDEI